MKKERITAAIHKLGINPCIDVPKAVVRRLLHIAKRKNGPVPVRGTLNGKKFLQTVVRYQGAWRLYLNTEMRREAGIDVGDTARVELEFNPIPRNFPMPRKLAVALSKNRKARAAFKKGNY